MKKIVLFSILIIASLTACSQTNTRQNETSAPVFTLPNALGGEVSLSDYLSVQPVLLYFHMAVG